MDGISTHFSFKELDGMEVIDVLFQPQDQLVLLIIDVQSIGTRRSISNVNFEKAPAR